MSAHRYLLRFSRMAHQVDEERKEAEAIKERVAKDEAAVASRQEEVLRQCPSEMSTNSPQNSTTIYFAGISPEALLR